MIIKTIQFWFLCGTLGAAIFIIRSLIFSRTKKDIFREAKRRKLSYRLVVVGFLLVGPITFVSAVKCTLEDIFKSA